MAIVIEQSPGHSTSTFTVSKSVAITAPDVGDLIVAVIGGRSNSSDDNGVISYADDFSGATRSLRTEWLPTTTQKGHWIEVVAKLSDGTETNITVNSSLEQTEMTLKVYVVSGLLALEAADRAIGNSSGDVPEVFEISTGESMALTGNDAFVVGILQVYDVIENQTWDVITGDGNSSRTYYGSQIRSAGGTLLEGPQWTTFDRRAVVGIAGWVTETASSPGPPGSGSGGLLQGLSLRM